MSNTLSGKTFLAVLLTGLCVLLPFSAAFAQEGERAPLAASRYYDNSFRGNPIFRLLVHRAIYRMPAGFDFTTFRVRYSQTRQYDPLGDRTSDEMLELAYIVQNEEDPVKVIEAIKAYRQLVMDHMANFRIVLQALSLSTLDRRFGNPRFFRWLKNGLARSIVYSGDGRSRGGAFDAITPLEETILFSHYGLKKLDTQSGWTGTHFYNIHEVQDLKTGQKWSMYVDLTFPMRRMEYDANGRNDLQFRLRKQ